MLNYVATALGIEKRGIVPRKADNNIDSDYADTLLYYGLVLTTLADLLTLFGVTIEREQAKQERGNQQTENVRGQEMNQQMLKMFRETEQMQKKMDHMQRQINRLQK